MKAWITSQRSPRLRVRPQPSGAHQGDLKSSELANLCPDTIEEVVGYAEEGLDRIGTDAELSFAFLRHGGLKL